MINPAPVKVWTPWRLTVCSLDKVYIDGPCGYRKLAGVLLACLERVSHVTHFYK